MGSGSPTIVLESGISATSLNWRQLQRDLAQDARVIAYDRAGLGWSDESPHRLTGTRLAEDLHELLLAADVRMPVILVGHSYGGLLVQRYAALYPQEVAGLVLLDPVAREEWHPLTPQKRSRLRTGVRLARRGVTLCRLGLLGPLVRLALAGARKLPRLVGRTVSSHGAAVLARITDEVGKMPPEVWPGVARHWSCAKHFRGLAAHLEALPESAQEMEGVSLPPQMPVTAIVPPGVRCEHATRLVEASSSGHWIHLDQPDLVLAEIRSMMAATEWSASPGWCASLPQ